MSKGTGSTSAGSGELERLRSRVSELEADVEAQTAQKALRDVWSLAEAFGQLGENRRSAFWVYDVDAGAFRYVSRSYERLFRRSREAIYADPRVWMETVHEEDRQTVLATFEKTAAGEASTAEYRLRRDDGTVRWIAGEGIPVRPPGGAGLYVVGQARDVTRRRLGIAALQQSERRFRRLFEANIIGILIANLEGAIVEANDAFLEMVGYDRSELPLRWDEMTPPEWRESDERARRSLGTTGVAAPWEKEYWHKDGHRIPILLGVARLEGTNDRAISFVMDLTDRKEAQRALERAHRELERKVAERTGELAAARDRLRLITDSLPALIGYIGTDRRYQFANAAYERWFGLPPAAVEGRHVREVIGAEAYELLRHPMQRALRGEPVSWDGETRLPKGMRYLHLELVPDRGAGGEVRGIHALVQDLTEQKRAEDDLRHAERMASIGTLAAGIAHEINNPLGVILLAAETALGSRQDRQAVRRALEAIERNAKRAARIVSSVLRFSREAGSVKEPADLNEVARRALELSREYTRSQSGKVDLVLAGSAPLMLMNRTEMEQVIVNLIQNSLQAGASRVEIRTERRSGTVVLSVRDDGEGIPPEQMPRVFDPFYTGREAHGGTGLGLSILHGIVRDHGGTVEVESARGVGTTITASFPSIDAATGGANP